jgi:glutamine amidotransferase
MIAIIDYGMGNLRSVQKALQKSGAEAEVYATPGGMEEAEALVLPGVGAFGQGMENLRARGFLPVIYQSVNAGKPLLGICLGLQLLFEESEEMGRHQGLGLFPGLVKRFDTAPGDAPLKVPHIGWNQIHPVRPSALLEGIPAGSYAYFVHSYYAEPRDESIILATTDYGLDFASVVGRDKIFGLQFHPEKSQAVGLRMLRNFVAYLGDLTGLSRPVRSEVERTT